METPIYNLQLYLANLRHGEPLTHPTRKIGSNRKVSPTCITKPTPHISDGILILKLPPMAYQSQYTFPSFFLVLSTNPKKTQKYRWDHPPKGWVMRAPYLWRPRSFLGLRCELPLSGRFFLRKTKGFEKHPAIGDSETWQFGGRRENAHFYPTQKKLDGDLKSPTTAKKIVP